MRRKQLFMIKKAKGGYSLQIMDIREEEIKGIKS